MEDIPSIARPEQIMEISLNTSLIIVGIAFTLSLFGNIIYKYTCTSLHLSSVTLHQGIGFIGYRATCKSLNPGKMEMWLLRGIPQG